MAKIKKIVTLVLVVSMFTLSTSPAYANTQKTVKINENKIPEEYENEISDELSEELKKDIRILKNYEPSFNEVQAKQYVEDVITQQSTVQPFVVPLLVRVVIKAAQSGVKMVAKSSKGFNVTFTGHATKRMFERRLTGSKIDDIMTTGARYTDTKSGARVAMKGTNAVIVDAKQNRVITVIDHVYYVKKHWKTSYWSY